MNRDFIVLNPCMDRVRSDHSEYSQAVLRSMGSRILLEETFLVTSRSAGVVEPTSLTTSSISRRQHWHSTRQPSVLVPLSVAS